MEPDDLSQWANRLVEGDEVMLSLGRGVFRHNKIGMVQKVTPKQVVVSDGSVSGRRFWKRDAQEVGGSGHIKPVTKADKAKLQKAWMIEQLRRTVDWDRMTAAQVSELWHTAKDYESREEGRVDDYG